VRPKRSSRPASNELTLSIPLQAIFAFAWAIVGPPLIVFAATRARRRKLSLHASLMIVAVIVEIAVFASFSTLDEPSARRPELRAHWIFFVHVAFVIAAAVGVAWQILSRTIERLRPLHRRTGPWVAGAWCGALLTGAYTFWFLYWCA
jgi:uncharacterized membrane protein YozB (DUF420 family)